MNALEVEHLVKRFGSVTAVDDISLTVREGETFGFLGPNGAGKTSTIRLLTNVLMPDAGTVRIPGIDIPHHPLEAKMRTDQQWRESIERLLKMLGIWEKID